MSGTIRKDDSIKKILLACGIALPLFASCQTSAPLGGPDEAATRSAGLSASDESEVHGIQLSILYAGPGPMRLSAGTTVLLDVISSPVLYRKFGDGFLWEHWDESGVAEMQFCSGEHEDCSFSNEWIPYSSWFLYSFRFDGVGARRIWISGRYRDARGNEVASISKGVDGTPQIRPRSSDFVDLIFEWDIQTPMGKLPETLQTQISSTQQAFPVVGSVRLNGGMGQTGGVAGETIRIRAAFAAESPYGQVVDMRITHASQVPGEWEPFVSEKEFPFFVGAGWGEFRLAVQFRDDKYNLSPVYEAMIIVEGH